MKWNSDTTYKHNWVKWVKIQIARLMATSVSPPLHLSVLCDAAGVEDSDAVAAFACQAQT